MTGALTGKRVIVTRAAQQADELCTLLEKNGAVALRYPCIELRPPDELTPLHQALDNLLHGGYDWLILTSANTVHVLADTLRQLKHPIEVAAVGPTTALAAMQTGLTITTLPATHSAEGLAAAMPPLHGAQILLPQSALADKSLAMALAERGAHVTAVAAYTMGVGSGGIDLVAELRAGRVDAITLTSPSAFHNLITRLTNEGGSSAQLTHIALACLGPTTAQAVSEARFTNLISPPTPSLHALIQALAAHFAR